MYLKKDKTLDMRYNVSKYHRRRIERNRTALYMLLVVFVCALYMGYEIGNNIINAIAPIGLYVPELDNTRFVRTTQTFRVKRVSGIASWYGEDSSECLGCRADLLMANGIRYNENNLTIASNDYALGQEVQVCHDLVCVNAVVTDTGGFNALGRVADLSKATKKVINCGDLCNVTIKNTTPLKGF